VAHRFVPDPVDSDVSVDDEVMLRRATSRAPFACCKGTLAPLRGTTKIITGFLY